ncbi:hypothetical protein GCM10009801_58920 [Streptomyces albiaxialis]|uniref:RHS repeat-associated core domain-containing protein n=1 Tax=Streptomyces albiaxialis TaxID=329523 RepID=A0ABN2WIF7_9ACTN
MVKESCLRCYDKVCPRRQAARTDSKWIDFSQNTALTQGGKEFQVKYASTDNSERVQFGDTALHHGPLGLFAQTTGGVDMTFTREVGGTLNSFRTEGKSYYYLTDALGSTEAVVNDQGEKVNTYYYSPRGVTVPTEKAPSPTASRQLPGPDAALPQRGSLLRHPHRPLHPTRPLRSGGQPVPVRVR